MVKKVIIEHRSSKQTQAVTCARCDGTGKVGLWRDQTCPACKGVGKVRL